MSIMSYNGGTVLAMAGHECVCVATDLRLGEEFLTVATNVKKVHKIDDKIYAGFTGFHSDAKTVLDKVLVQKSLYELRENRKIKPKIVGTVISNMLYNRRFGSYFIEPLVAGLDPATNKPYICAMDNIGCVGEPEDFVVIGTAAEYSLGVCEAFWRKDMNPDELFEATAQAMLSGLERDPMSGYGAIIYTITKDKVTVKSIKTRLD